MRYFATVSEQEREAWQKETAGVLRQLEETRELATRSQRCARREDETVRCEYEIRYDMKESQLRSVKSAALT